MTVEARLTALEARFAKLEKLMGGRLLLGSISRPAQVIESVRVWYGLSDSDLQQDDRRAMVVECRFVIWRLLSEYLDVSSAEIGRLMNRNHSAILNGLKRVQDRLSVDTVFADRVSRIVDQLGLKK